MNKEKEMFEAIEMHVERMLSHVSEDERKSNPALTKQEGRMQRLLDQLRKVVTSQECEAEESEASDASA